MPLLNRSTCCHLIQVVIYVFDTTKHLTKRWHVEGICGAFGDHYGLIGQGLLPGLFACMQGCAILNKRNVSC